jgi:HPt (histidine-containing phosphotransfer) domain-containing protein
VGQNEEPALEEALNRLWTKFLPQIEERVSALEAAASGLTDGTLNQDQQDAASATAHKLAGVLGTFGLHDGTTLAREAEAAYGNDLDGSKAVAARLTEIAAQLRAMLASRR